MTKNDAKSWILGEWKTIAHTSSKKEGLLYTYTFEEYYVTRSDSAFNTKVSYTITEELIITGIGIQGSRIELIAITQNEYYMVWKAGSVFYILVRIE